MHNKSCLWTLLASVTFCLVCANGHAYAQTITDKNPEAGQKFMPQKSAVQTGISMKSGQPIEVTAEESFEWKTELRQYIANGNAVAKQGDVELVADRLVADYRDKPGGGTEIWKLTAIGNVIIRSPGQTAYGDLATYELDHGVAVLTGKNLRIETRDQRVTARDAIEYYVAENKLIARGNAVASRGEDRLESDVLVAYFGQNDAGQTELQQVVANQQVIITTPTDTVQGNRGVYDIAGGLAVLEGDVVMTRGVNRLNGQRAEINLKTGSSRLFSGNKEGRGERVRGVFYPEKKDASEKSGQSAGDVVSDPVKKSGDKLSDH